MMKRVDLKSLVAGLVLGTMGITTVFASTGIKSAVLSNTTIMINGDSLPLNKSLISVTMDDEQDASLYVPVNELFEKLGYIIYYDSVNNTVDLVSENNSSHGDIADNTLGGNTVINLTNNTNQRNIAESGSFQAEKDQTLILNITSDIKGGTVELFLFDPSGKEHRITISSMDITKEIALEKGTWKYNCSGVFKDGGNVKIVGIIK